LKDDKIVANGGAFKTKIFYPKQLLYADGDKDRNKTERVGEKLGKLIVPGYKVQYGAMTEVSFAH
jgi:hypothetical protein